MSYETLLDVCDDKDKAVLIWELRKKVIKYTNFISLKNAGFVIGINDVSFEDAIIYGFIEETKRLKANE